MRRLAIASLSVAVLAGGMASGARADGVGCGAVVTSDVTLTGDLTGCPENGLVVGADGITIDLNGFSIQGAGPQAFGIGIHVAGRSRVTIANGTLRGFWGGVGIYDGTARSEVRGVAIDDVAVGISIADVFSSREIRLIGNTVTNASIGIRAEYVSGLYAERNSVSGAGTGISVRFGSATSLVRNSFSYNAGFGIYLEDAGTGLFDRNVANGNGGTGFASQNTHGTYVNNVMNGNGGVGLSIWDQDETHGSAFTVSGNVANANGDLGILVYFDGVDDGGKNRARANGDPRECVRITCN